MPVTTRRWPTPGCFDDVRVLEIGGESGDFCGMLLAGEGAEVIKIEPPEGSPGRRIGPYYEDRVDKERSLFFWMYNRGKLGVTVDLSQPQGVQRYLRLAETADVIIDAQGLNVMDRLELGYERIARLNKKVVYCSITPFGATGPWRHFKASDIVHQALGGSAFCTGYRQVREGVWDTPPFMPQSWHSYAIAGEHASVAIAAALLYRQINGEGQHIDAAIHDACAQSTEGTVTRYIYYKRNQLRDTPQQMRCADGRYLAVVTMLLGRPNLAKVLELLKNSGLDAGLGDPESNDPAAPGPDITDRLASALSRWAATKTASEAFHTLQGLRVLCAPVYPPEELIDDPHTREREDFVEVAHPELERSFTYPRHPRRQSVTPWRWGPRAPLLGEHDAEIWKEVLEK